MKLRIPLLLAALLALPACGPGEEAPDDPAPAPAPSPDPDPAPGPDEATLEVRTTEVLESSALRVGATGLPASERFVLGFGPPQSEYQVVTPVMSDARGSLEVLVPVPDWFEPDRSYVAVIDQQVRGGFKVIGEPFTARPRGDLMLIRGTWTDEGVECPAVRGEDGTLYTLAGGDADAYQPGDELIVLAAPVEMSFCMQGTTVEVASLRRAP